MHVRRARRTGRVELDAALAAPAARSGAGIVEHARAARPARAHIDSLPASIWARSSTSLISVSRCWPASTMLSPYSSAGSALEGASSPMLSSWPKPRMALAACAARGSCGQEAALGARWPAPPRAWPPAARGSTPPAARCARRTRSSSSSFSLRRRSSVVRCSVTSCSVLNQRGPVGASAALEASMTCEMQMERPSGWLQAISNSPRARPVLDRLADLQHEIGTIFGMHQALGPLRQGGGQVGCGHPDQAGQVVRPVYQGAVGPLSSGSGEARDGLRLRSAASRRRSARSARHPFGDVDGADEARGAPHVGASRAR